METLTAWYNVVFLIPVAIGLVLALGTLLGIGDADMDIDGDVGMDADTDYEKSGNPLDMPPKASPSLLMRLLSALGFGKVPLTLLLMIGMLMFGLAGFTATQFLAPVFAGETLVMGLCSVAVAFTVTTATTGRLARVINRVAPTSTSHGIKSGDLVGHTGRLIIRANAEHGVAHVYDRYDNLQKVHCRTEKGELPIGTEVLVLDYDSETDTYTVERSTVNAAS